MNTKIVYIVVSDATDFYLEQTILSIYSARLHNKSANIELVVDSETDKTIIGNRACILNYISKKIVVDISNEYSKVAKSRIIKTNLMSYIQGDFLFVDSDTIITDSLCEIDNFDGVIGAVLNLHVPLECHSKRDEQKVRKRIMQVGYNLTDNIPYYNSGVILVKDCVQTHNFYKIWHNKWHNTMKQHGLYKDQPSMAVANIEAGNIIKELDGVWNCQILNNGLPYLTNAKIIHYFASVYSVKSDFPYIFLDKKIYNNIQANCGVSYQVDAYIRTAKNAFPKSCTIVTGRDMEFLSDNLHAVAVKYSALYNVFNKLIGSVVYAANKLKNIFKR